MITIGQLAEYAGVTVKAVRHYHRLGLLAEPVRDSSGYRRYSAEQAIELVKIKTLAEAGVPLARVKEMLTADQEQFARAVAEIHRNLAERAEQLRRAGERISQLSAGDRLFVSDEVGDYLDALVHLGVSRRLVRQERNVWILLQSVAPEQARKWIIDKRDALADPEFLEIYLGYDAVFDFPADDPRLEALAVRSSRWIGGHPRSGGAALTPVVVDLVSTAAETSPSWDRLAELVRWRTSVNHVS